MLANVRVLESAPSESSSSAKPAGERPPPAVNEKSCGSLGAELWTTTRLPCLRFVNVQVTCSPGLRSIAETGLASSQPVPARSQPASDPSSAEYVPGVTDENWRVFESVPSESSSSAKLAG